MRDPYDILGVSRQATPDEIKSAYRKLARQYHPDVNPGNPEAEEKFKELSQAYSVLSDPDRKARFDRTGSTDDQGMGAPGDFFGDGGFGDLFEAFFGGQGGGRRGPDRDGQDLRADVIITLEEVLEGVEKTVRYRRSATCQACSGNGTSDGSPAPTCPQCQGAGQVTQIKQTFLGQVRTSTPCPTCRGTGKKIENACKVCHGEGVAPQDAEVSVTIPAGVETGQNLRVAAQGSDGLRGGRPGDLYVTITVADDKRFERHGIDLMTEVELTFAQAAIGDQVDIEGLTDMLEVNIDSGTQAGDVLRIKGEGLPRLHGGQRGDLFVKIDVAVPKKLTEAEEALLREFAELRGESVPKGPQKSGIFGSWFKGKQK